MKMRKICLPCSIIFIFISFFAWSNNMIFHPRTQFWTKHYMGNHDKRETFYENVETRKTEFEFLFRLFMWCGYIFRIALLLFELFHKWLFYCYDDGGANPKNAKCSSGVICCFAGVLLKCVMVSDGFLLFALVSVF